MKATVVQAGNYYLLKYGSFEFQEFYGETTEHWKLVECDHD